MAHILEWRVRSKLHWCRPAGCRSRMSSPARQSLRSIPCGSIPAPDVTASKRFMLRSQSLYHFTSLPDLPVHPIAAVHPQYYPHDYFRCRLLHHAACDVLQWLHNYLNLHWGTAWEISLRLGNSEGSCWRVGRKNDNGETGAAKGRARLDLLLRLKPWSCKYAE